LHTLQQEKQRIKIYCSFQEELMKNKIIFIKSNYKQIIGEEFLPYTTEKNKKVSDILNWVNEFVLSKFLKGDIDGKSPLSGSLLKIVEVGIVHLFNKFAKK
jgi:hypothetical protein